jgi:hypothetical protein
MNNEMAELKELLNLFEKEKLIVSHLEADYFNHSFTFSLYPEGIASSDEFFKRLYEQYPLSAGLAKMIEDKGYKIIRYTSDIYVHENQKKQGFFLLSIG